MVVWVRVRGERREKTSFKGAFTTSCKRLITFKSAFTSIFKRRLITRRLSTSKPSRDQTVFDGSALHTCACLSTGVLDARHSLAGS